MNNAAVFDRREPAENTFSMATRCCGPRARPPVIPIAGWTDTQIWEHARLHGFTIATKDADFTNRVRVSQKPARVIHIRFGNVRLTELRQIIEGRWLRIAKLSSEYRTLTFTGTEPSSAAEAPGRGIWDTRTVTKDLRP